MIQQHRIELVGGPSDGLFIDMGLDDDLDLDAVRLVTQESLKACGPGGSYKRTAEIRPATGRELYAFVFKSLEAAPT